jgi:hypothetical protein
MVARRFQLADHLEMDRLIVHYDFVWAPGGSILQSDWEKRALSIIGAAREVTLVTLWTPPERLERQLIDGKLRAALPYNALQVIKAGFFRLLPEFVVQRLSRAKMVDLFNRVFPGRLLTHHLLLLRVYSKGGSTADLYRKWLRFCDENVPHARAHCIVEFDSELKLHSREEWESVVASLTEDPAA